MNQPPSFPWRWRNLPVGPPEEVVNVARLPEKPLELDYRTQPKLPEEEDNHTRETVLVIALVAVVMSFLLHIEPMAKEFFGDPRIISITGGMSLWFGIILVATGRIKPSAMRALFVAGLGTGVLLMLVYHAS